MTDIVFSLREAAKLPKESIAVGIMANAAADEIERLRGALSDAIDFIDPHTDPWLHVTHSEMAKRLHAALTRA